MRFRRKKKMRILFVSATLPPEGSATAGIIGNIMIEMKNRGEEVDGLTLKNHILDASTSYWNNIAIYHANYVREYSIKSHSFSDITFKIKRKVYDLIYEAQARPYRNLAVEALARALIQINADSTYDVIIAAAAFYDAVEAVRRYREKLDKYRRAKYVLYQVDPLQENSAFKEIDSTWIESYERELYSQADHVFTTRIIYEMKKKKRWSMENVTAVDFPCVDMSLSTRTSSLKKDEGEIRCIYAGLLNEKVRDATVTLKILSKIKSHYISFYFIGSGQEELLRQYSTGPLAGRLHIMGSMPAHECEDWLLSADILLIIGNNTVNQVPSKIFTYMSYGLPIVATCKSQECPARKYLQEIPNAFIAEESEKDIDCLSTQIEDFIKSHANMRLTRQQIEQYANNYTPEHIVSTFISEFMKSR